MIFSFFRFDNTPKVDQSKSGSKPSGSNQAFTWSPKADSRTCELVPVCDLEMINELTFEISFLSRRLFPCSTQPQCVTPVNGKWITPATASPSTAFYCFISRVATESRRKRFSEGSPGRRRPRRPGSLKPSFPSLKSLLVIVRSLRTGTKNLKVQDGEDVDVLWRPGPGMIQTRVKQSYSNHCGNILLESFGIFLGCIKWINPNCNTFCWN